MSETGADRTLSALECVTTEATRLSEQGTNCNLATLSELLSERGRLLESVANQGTHTALSFSDWNRLVIVCHLGSQIAKNLAATRNALILEWNAAERQKAFAVCVTAAINPTAVPLHTSNF